MTTSFKEYSIEITDDPGYVPGSTGNLFNYDKVYYDDELCKPTSKHGIRISRAGQNVTSAIICETGGGTGIHDQSFIIKDDALFICCCDTVYSLKLPDLILNWKKECDTATCFAIYPFKDDLIIHGELEITRIDLNGNIKWSFSARDIFVTLDGRDAITVTSDKIEVIDWDGNKYILNDQGQMTD